VALVSNVPNAAATHMLTQPPQRGRRVGLIHEDEPADHGIELLLRGERIDLNSLEPHESLSCGGGALTRNIDRLGRPVDAEHRPGRADKCRGEQGHVTDSASDIEHVHASRKTGTPQHVLREIAEECALPF
jgi:hypothetical protein